MHAESESVGILWFGGILVSRAYSSVYSVLGAMDGRRPQQNSSTNSILVWSTRPNPLNVQARNFCDRQQDGHSFVVESRCDT